MHFISLVAVEMPKIKENQAENQEVEKCLEELREAYKQDSKNIVLELQIERLSGLTTEFARALDHSVYRNGHISRERFIKIQSDNKAEDERLQQKIAEKNVLLNECIQKQKALTLAGQDAERIQALTEYRPEVISRLIDKVRVFEGGRIEIGLKSKYLTDIIGECIPGLAS